MHTECRCMRKKHLCEALNARSRNLKMALDQCLSKRCKFESFRARVVPILFVCQWLFDVPNMTVFQIRFWVLRIVGTSVYREGSFCKLPSRLKFWLWITWHSTLLAISTRQIDYNTFKGLTLWFIIGNCTWWNQWKLSSSDGVMDTHSIFISESCFYRENRNNIWG